MGMNCCTEPITHVLVYTPSCTDTINRTHSRTYRVVRAQSHTRSYVYTKLYTPSCSRSAVPTRWLTPRRTLCDVDRQRGVTRTPRQSLNPSDSHTLILSSRRVSASSDVIASLADTHAYDRSRDCAAAHARGRTSARCDGDAVRAPISAAFRAAASLRFRIRPNTVPGPYISTRAPRCGVNGTIFKNGLWLGLTYFVNFLLNSLILFIGFSTILQSRNKFCYSALYSLELIYVFLQMRSPSSNTVFLNRSNNWFSRSNGTIYRVMLYLFSPSPISGSSSSLRFHIIPTISNP